MHNSNGTDDPIRVPGEKPPEDREAWKEYIISVHQKTPERLEDVAKFLSGMISIGLSIFLAVTGGKTGLTSLPHSGWIMSGIMLWIFSLIVSFFVIFPQKYPYVENSTQSIKNMHQRIVKVKRRLLTISVVFFIAAMLMLVYALV